MTSADVIFTMGNITIKCRTGKIESIDDCGATIAAAVQNELKLLVPPKLALLEAAVSEYAGKIAALNATIDDLRAQQAPAMVAKEEAPKRSRKSAE